MLDSLLHRHKPDILDCIANLSNDEVFTPPVLANKMLDLLPPEVWTNPELRFLDPGCKSGVFLREAAKRLMKGLEAAIPNETARREHIFKHMLHGIAITELTAQISRRTLYYSKDASSEHSVVAMPTADGNIRYQNIAHTFKNKSCTHCGATEAATRELELFESHAYLFIHEELDPSMKFDVIIGNPPYQLTTGGHGAQAKPIYHLFVEAAKKLSPKYMSFIIPSRWFSGGMGLDDFRSTMLSDTSIKNLIDHPDSGDCFPGVEIKGGVCYFLRDASYSGSCEVKTIIGNNEEVSRRNLGEQDVFVRFPKALSILKKVQEMNEPRYSTVCSALDPFGFASNYESGEPAEFEGAIKLYLRGEQRWVPFASVKKSKDLVGKWKLITSKAYGAGESFPHQITGVPFVLEPNTVCSFTYFVCGHADTEDEVRNMESYLKTKFVRFLVSRPCKTPKTPTGRRFWPEIYPKKSPRN